MRLEQCRWREPGGWEGSPPGELGERAGLVLVFGATAVLERPEPLAAVRRAWPRAEVLGCSTAGEILGTEVTDGTLTATAVEFASTGVRAVWTELQAAGQSAATGARLAERLAGEQLVHVLVLSEGITVNGSELVRGLRERLPEQVSVTGGLAGDGERFGRTLVVCGGTVRPQAVAAVGLYGERLRVGYGSLGGWDPFGPERTITRAEGNVLYELDHRPALELYRRYLGEYAAGLPATALLFPLTVQAEDGTGWLVRTVLQIDERSGGMVFAGDMPLGARCRLMKANFDRLVDGALGAASRTQQSLGAMRAGLAVLISCVGRKMVLRQRIEEEVEAVREVLGSQAALTGFYSYGELSPLLPRARCELHNQTMTITAFAER
ncbi:MAG: hypothetical protein KatS3mg102_2475 [Planctomycetota bacterium]|nr:MAG: hypothetical protein KatS3mg102_2475 [Planctomycetota bacterium]